MSKLRVGETLDTSIRIYRENFGKLVVLSAIAAVPPAALNLALNGALSSNWMYSLYTMWWRPDIFQQTWARTDFLVKAAEVGVIEGILGLTSMAAASILALAAMRSETPLLGRSLARGVRSLPSLIPPAIVVTLLTIVGTALCILPGFFNKMFFALIVPVVVIEGAGPIKCLGRSSRLTKSVRWVVLAVILITTLMVMIISTATSLSFGFLSGVTPFSAARDPSQTVKAFYLRFIGSLIASVLLTPLHWIPRTVMFVRLREQKEASELEYSVDRLLERNFVSNSRPSSQTDVGRSHR